MSGFLSNTTKILTGNVASLAIVMLSLPVITRMYGPEAYGQLVIFNSFVSLGAAITSLGYEKAFLIPRRESTASLLLLISMILVLVFSVLYEIIIISVGKYNISHYISDEFKYELLVFAPLAIALFSCARVLRFWSIRQNSFKNQAVAIVSGTAVEKGAALAVGTMVSTAGALITTRIIGLCASVIVLIYDARTSIVYSQRHLVHRVIFLAKRFSHYSYSSLSSLLGAASREMPYLLLATLFNPTVTAYFGLARGAIGVPLMQLSDALTRAFYQRVMKAQHNGEDIQNLCSSLLHIMILFASCPVILVYLEGEILIPLVFGDEWSDAGRAIGLVCISFFSAAVYRPIGILFDMLEKQKERVYFNVMLLAGSMLAILYGSGSGDPERAMAYYVFVVSALYVLVINYLMTLVGMSVLDSIKAVLRPLSVSLLMIFVPIYLLQLLDISPMLLLILSIGICVIFYGIIYLIDPDIRIITRRIMKKDG